MARAATKARKESPKLQPNLPTRPAPPRSLRPQKLAANANRRLQPQPPAHPARAMHCCQSPSQPTLLDPLPPTYQLKLTNNKRHPLLPPTLPILLQQSSHTNVMAMPCLTTRPLVPPPTWPLNTQTPPSYKTMMPWPLLLIRPPPPKAPSHPILCWHGQLHPPWLPHRTCSSSL